MMNAKDEPVDKADFTMLEKFTPTLFDALYREIIDCLGKENCLVPDDIRGNYATLEEAVLAGNWPTVKQASGKFIFILRETGEKIELYTQGHSSFKGSKLFANAQPGTTEAAILIRNHPKEHNIETLVEKGYIVRTHTDSDTKAVSTNDHSYFKAACRSGAQIITTNYYQKSTHFISSYVNSFANKTYIRKNGLMTTAVKTKGSNGRVIYGPKNKGCCLYRRENLFGYARHQSL